MEGLGADSEEKREPVSDIDTAAMDGLKVLDLKRPIREADYFQSRTALRFRGQKRSGSPLDREFIGRRQSIASGAFIVDA